MTLPIAEVDHITDGTSHVISQYRDKPRLMMRIACYLNTIQLPEEQLALIHEAFRPDTATGFRLDWIGAKVGQGRVGANDDVYRVYVKARIRANRSRAHVEDLWAIEDLLLTNCTHVERNDHVGIEVYSTDAKSPAEFDAIWEILQTAAGSGIPVRLYGGEVVHWFDLASADDAPSLDDGLDSADGFANAGILAQSVGI